MQNLWRNGHMVRFLGSVFIVPAIIYLTVFHGEMFIYVFWGLVALLYIAFIWHLTE